MEDIKWDLSGMFASPSDPKIDERISQLKSQTEQFITELKGKLQTENSAVKLTQILQKLEAFYVEKMELELYAALVYSGDMTQKDAEAVYNKVDNISTEIDKDLAFIGIELGELVVKNPDLIQATEISAYKHFLERIFREAKHHLSETEERIILDKDQFGVKAWSQLQSKWLNTRQIPVSVENVPQKLPYGKANGLLHHPDRSTRSSANIGIYGTLGKDEEIFASALRNITADWINTAKLRKFDTPMHQSLIDNDTENETIQNLMQTIENSRGIYQDYLKTKAKLMNLDLLGCEDIVAPVPGLPHKEYSWDDAKTMMLEAYAKFDAKFHSIAQDMVNNELIDASPRNGKRNGAFCAEWLKGNKAYILLSFGGDMNGIYTLSHEMGHAIHDYLMEEKQSHYNTEVPMIVAETASIFGELLLTDLMLSKATDPKEKLAILGNVLDEAGMAVFQVSARVWFEQSLYDAIEKGEFLDGETIAKYWCTGRDKIYGDAVHWYDEMRWEWTMKPHYFMPNFRFYNYPYVYAQLFVYALYNIYKQQGSAFIPKFKEALGMGASKSPLQIAEFLGLDISGTGIWETGIAQFRDFVDQYRELSKDL